MRVFKASVCNRALGECRGFTLIELILVLVIIGLLTSLIVPAITSLTGLKLKTATRRVAAGLRYARSQAVTTGSDYQVVLNLRKGEMTIKCLEEEEERSYWETAEEGEYQSGWEEDERDEGAVDEELPPPKKKIKTYRMPKEVTLAKVIIEEVEVYHDDEEEETGIDFYPNGSCSGGEIYLTNERERVFKIALNFLTGIVKITEEEEV